MKRVLLTYTCNLVVGVLFAQEINCDALYDKDSPCYEACQSYNRAAWDWSYKQGSRLSQMSLDTNVFLCPTFGKAYYVKAIPYLKRGEFVQWKQLIDSAVKYEPNTYMGYRGGARFMFLRDYEGAISDIERCDSLLTIDIGYIYNGDYHLQMVRAFSYAALGQKGNALAIMQDYLAKAPYAGPFDYLHLGVLQMELKQHDEALKSFAAQVKNNDYVADAYYYAAMVYKHQGNVQECKGNLEKAKKYFLSGKSLPGKSSYIDYPDKVYLQQIEKELFLIINR
ncbi:MAG: tetratricopeptide repeat protein [Prevotellaceae bacterium]|jgi:tetratricopeptide (TPR) repeat protein|nr:tetratricopeptide repeat protein [Prevotellaceae bacterium]